MSDGLHTLTLAELARRIESRELSPVELAGALLARIESLDGQVNAFITRTAELAMARARQAEQRAREARLGETNLRRQLERALAQSVADVQNSSAAVLARKESAQVAAVALEAVREQFAFRRGSLLDLLRAQEELHQATQTLARYRFLHLSADLAPMFNVPVDAPAPALAPLLPWLKGRR